jgi:CheY-like chemotaxis protein
MSQDAAGDKARPTVLVVDDNAELRALLMAWLGQLNYRAVEAANGSTAVTVAVREHPDLIFMDLHMPKMDGFAATKRLRSLANLGNDVPIIAISADYELGREAGQPTTEAHDAGFTDFIQKPFSPTQLEDILAHYLLKTRRAPNE